MERVDLVLDDLSVGNFTTQDLICLLNLDILICAERKNEQKTLFVQTNVPACLPRSHHQHPG